MKKVSESVLKNHQYKDRYFMDGFIDPAIFYSKVDMTITRAGSAMFEMALWQLPMLVIPIGQNVSRDQKTNAYTMSGKGVALVLEENNLSNTVILSEISRIMDDKIMYEKMSQAGKQFESSRTAAGVIAREIIRIGLSHS